MNYSLTMRLTLLCVSLSLSNCATGPEPIDDSYCWLYHPLITKKGDAEKLAPVPKDQRLIILGNEQVYRQNCSNGNRK